MATSKSVKGISSHIHCLDGWRKEWRRCRIHLQDLILPLFPFPFHWCSHCRPLSRPGHFSKGNQNDGQAPPTFQDFYSSLSRRITRTCSWELSEGLFWQFVGNCKIFAQNNSIGFVDDWFWHFSLDWILGFESLNWIGIFLSLISIQVLIYLDSCASCSS